MHTDSSGGIAADRREQQQMRKKAVKNAGMIRIYLNMAWKLLQKNLLSIVIFETVYRLFSSQLVSRLANAAINFSLKQLGTSYMTSENFNKIMLHPLTLLLIFGIMLVFFFCMLFEIYAVMAALEASWKRKRISVPVMMLAGGRGAAQFVRARPWTWFFYMAASFPYLWLHSSYSAIRSMKLLQVSLTKIFNAFPAYWIPVVLTVLLVAFSFVFSYTIPFRCMMTEKEKNTHLRVRQTLEKRVLRELGINVSFQVMIFLITWVLYLIFGTAVVAYAKLVKTPSTVVSTVIVYGDWVKSTMSLIGGAFGLVGSITYLYLIFIRSSRKGYQKSRTTKKPRSKLVRTFCGPVTAVVLTIAMLAGETVYLVYAMRATRAEATASSQYISVSAHRGGARKAPENTMSAIKYAVDSMSDYAEIDVQETSDGEIVLMHDTNLKRTTGLNASIWTLTYDEISQLDAGVRFNKKFRGEQIPKLEEVIAYAKGKINLNIEVKYNGHNQNIVKKVVKIIEDNDFVDQCVLTSMNYNFLRQAKKINPDIKTGYTMKMSYGGLEDMDAADFFSVKYTYITESFVEHAHSLGKEVCAWTLNYQGDMQRMVNCGVDNIITDDPELVRKVILGTTDRNPGFVSLLGYALK